MKIAVLVVVAALGMAWLYARHSEAAADHPAWNRIASELAHRPVTVHCQGFVSAALDVSAEAGTVQFDAQGRPADYTDLKRDVCNALTRYPHDSTTLAFACVEQNVPCSNRIFADVQAVHTLAHEAAHLGGQIGEAAAECQALHSTAYVAERLGSSATQAAAVARYAFAHLYPNLPDAYKSDCTV